MNFGNWIVVAFVLFALFIGTLVTICVKQDISLVSKDYYKEELAYQHQIKKISNTNALDHKPEIKITSGQIAINFLTGTGNINGELNLFCPSNSKLDKHYELKADAGSTQTFDVNGLPGGMYRAKLSWTMDGKEYYYEEVIYL